MKQRKERKIETRYDSPSYLGSMRSPSWFWIILRVLRNSYVFVNCFAPSFEEKHKKGLSFLTYVAQVYCVLDYDIFLRTFKSRDIRANKEEAKEVNSHHQLKKPKSETKAASNRQKAT
ncbi:hypothetical protein GQX74_006885 [Glossina fuscipes]|nr:hypothetical protein GQX74_006885 [Glossina fuscipes]